MGCVNYGYSQITNSPFVFPYISYRRSGEKLLKYQENLTWVIMLSILMTSLTDKPLILQGEVRLRSLLGLKGLIIGPEGRYLLNLSLPPKRWILSKVNSKLFPRFSHLSLNMGEFLSS